MEKKERKSSCWSCKSLDVQRWGKRDNKQRFRCNNCGLYFTSENHGVKNSNEQVWFRHWVIDRQTLKSISAASGISKRSLQRKFDGYLKEYPRWIIPKYKIVNLVIDGTYFSNKICLFVYRESTLKLTMLYRTTTEEYAEEICEDLVNILKLGVIIESITCDGNKAILKAINGTNKWIKKYNKENDSLHKPIVIQRCLVHVMRYSLSCLRKEHKSVEGRRLRAICMTICKIDSQVKEELFQNALEFWFNDNKSYVTQLSQSKSGKPRRTHTEIYKAYMALKRALPNMFHYLKNKKIPHTTNAIESYFSHLKSDIEFHRGLSIKHFKSFLKWYVFFKNDC